MNPLNMGDFRVYVHLPEGNFSQSYGESPCFIGRSSVNVPFSSHSIATVDGPAKSFTLDG